MNFEIPRNNASELLLYIMKIIDLPYTTINDLLYQISFELFILPPDKAVEFIKITIKNGLLKEDANQNVLLSQNLKNKLKSWQLKRKKTILNKLNSRINKSSTTNIDKYEKDTNYNTLLKAFLDKGTINRAATISEAAFNITEFDSNKGIIKANVYGKKEDSYNIQINTKKRTLSHNCDDFEIRRAENKKFCKHLAKLFLILKEKNEESATKFLKEIAKNINEWKFSG